MLFFWLKNLHFTFKNSIDKLLKNYNPRFNTVLNIQLFHQSNFHLQKYLVRNKR